MIAPARWLLVLGLSVVSVLATPRVNDAEAILDVDYESGRVTAVHIVKSTGQPKLDKAARDTFMKWRFKPHTVKHARMPITVKIGDEKS